MEALIGQPTELPSPTSIRNWLLRVGLYQLRRPLEQADDWIWIVDHTVQLGELKCFVIVGFRHSAWLRQEERTLRHEDVELVDLVPVRTSNGEVVDQQLEAATKRTGVPKLIISDEGRDLHRGLALFEQRHVRVQWIYDIKHKTACLLKRELEHDPVWAEFSQRANEAKRQVQQTELAFSNPPQQRGKARYMSVDVLVDWGRNVLAWLDHPQPTGRELDPERVESKLGWLRAYRQPIERWQRALEVVELVESTVRKEGYHAGSVETLRQKLPPADPEQFSGRLSTALLEFVTEQAAKASGQGPIPGSSEVLESIIGRYKNMQGETGQFGVTSMLLSIGAFVGKLTIGGIRKALETITSPQLKSWERSALGVTIQSQRKRAFSTSRPGTKPVPTASPSIA
jgi:hypothetical protein